MGEIKTNDLQEVKKSALENYQNIRPETDMKVQEARNTWNSVFSIQTDGLRSEGLKDSNKDGAKEINKENSNLKSENSSNQKTGNEFRNRGELTITNEEKELLQKLSSGELDGLVGNVVFTTGNSSVWTEIRDGNPVRYKQGPGGKFFDGNENVRYEGVKHLLEEWKTDDEKLAFLQKYGWLIENDDVKNYSSKFKPEIK